MSPKSKTTINDKLSKLWFINELSLKDVITFHKGKGLSKDDINVDGQFPCIRYGELYTTYAETTSKIYSRTNIYNNIMLSKYGDILIPSSGETAIDIAVATTVLKDDVIIGGDINILRPNLDKLNPIYLSYLLNTAKKVDIAKMSQGSSVIHLYNEQLKKLYINVHEMEVQVKIATLLSLIDELIESQNSLITYYEREMKYVYARCFESTDISDQLGYICSLSKGKQLNKEHFIASGEYKVFNGGKNNSGYTDNFNAKSGSITISEGGASSGYIRKINEDFWSGGHNYVISFDSKVDYNYLFHLLKFNKAKIENLALGSGMPNIPLKSINSLMLNYHSNIKTQTGISRALDKYLELIKLIDMEKSEYLNLKKQYLNIIFK